jgi:1,4-dihydroxy-2-naphthoyl-CoA synthase
LKKNNNFIYLASNDSKSKTEEKPNEKTFEDVQLIKKSALHWELILNRPEKYNAITQPMYERIIQIIDQAAQDKQLVLLSFTGKGKFYSAGTDLADFAKMAVRYFTFIGTDSYIERLQFNIFQTRIRTVFMIGKDIFEYPQVKKSDIRSSHPHAISCNLEKSYKNLIQNLRLINLASDHTTFSFKILHPFYFHYKSVLIF